VAREITWNPKLNPAPVPPRPLEEMYTRPHHDLSGDAVKQADMDRKQFEATLMGFYATQAANSDQLANTFLPLPPRMGRGSDDTRGRQGRLQLPRRSGNTIPGSTIRDADVMLVSAGGLTLISMCRRITSTRLEASFAPSVTAEQRFRMATLEDEQRIVTELR